MFSWYINAMTVAGPAKDLRAFADAARSADTCFSLETLLPTPAQLQAPAPLGAFDTSKYGADDRLRARLEADVARCGHSEWVGWRTAHWGTPWDAEGAFTIGIGPIENDPLDRASADYFFSTVNDGPLRAIETLSRGYPTLLFVLSFRAETEYFDDDRSTFLFLGGWCLDPMEVPFGTLDLHRGRAQRDDMRSEKH